MLERQRNQKGAVSALVAFAMVCLLGFAGLVIDFGMVYLNKSELINMVDAAALAGAQELPMKPLNAVSVAEDYCSVGKNGRVGDKFTATVGNGATSINVQASRKVNFMFAQFLGLIGTEVTASATASLSPVGGASGILPFGVPQRLVDGTQNGDVIVLMEDKTSGNFGALAFADSGGNDYRTNIVNGYNGTVKVGDRVTTEPGNMVGPTYQGITQRIDGDSSTFENVTPSAKRRGIIPIIDVLPNGRGESTVVGFITVYIDTVIGGDVYVRRKDTSVGNNIPAEGTNYGTYSIRLTQ